MTRIKRKEWALQDEIRKRKQRVNTKFPLFRYYLCAVCGDALRFERVWKIEEKSSCKFKIICQQCVSTWEEALDKADDPSSAKAIYSSDNY